MLPLVTSLALAATLEVPGVHPTIQSAVDVAVAGDVIEIAAGSYCEDIDIVLPLELRGPSVGEAVLDGTCGDGDGVLLMGTGSDGASITNLVVDGAGLFRGLYVTDNVAVTATNLTVRNGADNDGAGIYVGDDATLTCTGCFITNNHAADTGGGIFGVGNITLIDSDVCNNSGVLGGGVYSGGQTVFRRTAIVRNTAAEGGGLWVSGYGGHLVHNSVFLENTQTGNPDYGSAIFVEDALDLRNSIITGSVGATHAVDNDDEVNLGGHNLYADNSDVHVAEPYLNDLLDGAVTFVDVGTDCTYDVHLDAAGVNDGIGTGDPFLSPVGAYTDMGIGFVSDLPDADGDLFPDAIDCQADNPAVFPGARELCNGLDENCLGVPSNETDPDGDGYWGCEGDCATGDATRYPGAPIDDDDVGDGIDRDCNGFDECFLDGDGDGFGVSTYVDADEYDVCLAGSTTTPGDCDDGESTTNPGAVEICDAVDNDCDELIDDDDDSVTGQTTWFFDDDDDLYGDPLSSQVACDQPVDHVDDGNDCNDSDPYENPGVAEVCDGVDNDCDNLVDDDDDDVTGQSTWYPDTDNDGQGDPAGTPIVSCGRPVGYVSNTDDCDDDAPTTFVGAVEQCDGIDNDCDELIDEDVSFVDWYPDTDSDGFGDPGGPSVYDCAAPPNHVNNALDCDDSSNTVSPAVPEIPCDGIDNDCDPGTPDGPCDTGDTGVPSDADTDADADSDTDVDADTDADTDADADADTDADTDTDTDTEQVPSTNTKAPEPEDPDYGCGCAEASRPTAWLPFARR